MKSHKKNNDILYRRKKTKIGKGFILFIFVCFLTSIIFLASALSNILSVNVFKLGIFSNAVSISQTTLYCIAFGDYESEEAAVVQSEYIKSKGGAGLIYKNAESYTILLSAYLSQQACNNVYDKNIEIFKELNKVNISLNKEKIQHNKTKDVSVLNNIIQLPISTFNTLHEITNSYDGGLITSHETYNLLFNLSYNINSAIEEFKNSSMLTSEENYNKLLQQANNIYSKVNNLILNTSKSELGWKIKYCSLDVILLVS